MTFEIMILAIVVGLLRGGNIKKLEDLYIRGWYLLVASFILEMISIFIVSQTNHSLTRIIEEKFIYIHAFTYFLLITGVFLNYREKGFKLILSGSILNFLPIIFNSGKMPVSIKSLKNSGLYNQLDLLYDGRIMTHTLATKNTNLNFLGDIIPLPKPYPFPKIISVGDILIGLGIFILVYSYMTKRKSDTRSNSVIFKP